MDKLGDIIGSITELIGKAAMPILICVLVFMAAKAIKNRFFDK